MDEGQKDIAILQADAVKEISDPILSKMLAVKEQVPVAADGTLTLPVELTGPEEDALTKLDLGEDEQIRVEELGKHPRVF